MTGAKTLVAISTSALALGLLALTILARTTPQEQQATGVTNVVLVHGAWADGSSWSKVIPLLDAKGLHVVAVQLPLTSLADDAAAVRRALALEDGPVLLVAHSYGGVVITETGNDPKVAGLVYVASLAPMEGQSAFDLTNAYPTPILQEVRPDAFGFLRITPKGIREDFAPDLSDAEQAVLTATQRPTAAAGSLGAPVSAAAWRNKPCWFVIANDDRVIAPALQAEGARRMSATSITLSASHVAMLSHSNAVAAFIRWAARGER
jgi:pimeloyl-ACP methyl ester carboxylesterase